MNNEILQAIAELKTEMNARFNEVDKRFDEVDTQLADIKHDMTEAFKDIAIGQERLEDHVAMYHVRGTVMQAMQ